ncbi:response regulator transcription factor [Dactylosporangium matsuzakiense]|uniref:DNA-binding response regulator n=1 Tax=Dactylosporangium matsuzakiense TaxID=53360 RepID=A0A9W6NPZ8_9ACTN|nr:response regulator transcription factor [Dactylosporangium matsuzakiense]UWZ41287.1 response regulator transcription factor [Dactylosporangium matsuzakiense]GLL05665.1 DNA-binding response regulator [Dactylosporangium matsuzakiense]
MPSVEPIRVTVAEDHALYRELLVEHLRHQGVDVVAETADATGLRRAVRATRPDVAIIDIRLPPGPGPTGLHAAVEIRRTDPDVGVLLLSQYVETQFFTTLVAGGLRKVGYLLKERVGGTDDFVTAVRRITAGGCVVDPDISAHLLHGRPEPALAGLTDRQAEVLALIAAGLSNIAIAGRLGIGGSTVETHARAVYQQLGIADEKDTHQRVLAVLMYWQARRDRA